MESTFKKCSVCGEEKPLSGFNKKGRVCKACSNEKSRAYYREHSEHLNKIGKLYVNANKEEVYAKRKEYRSKNGGLISNQQKKWRTRGSLYKTYYDQLKGIEKINEGDNGSLMVECAFCKKEFNPTNTQVSERVKALNSLDGVESKLYCSDECKYNCPVYRQVSHNKKDLKRVYREHSSVFTEMVLDDRGRKCEKCGSKDNLLVHHILGYTMHPSRRFDLDNVLVVCGKCHMEIHATDGCKVNQLRCPEGGKS